MKIKCIDCGKERNVRGARAKYQKRCQDCNQKNRAGQTLPQIDIVGQTYGKLTVLKYNSGSRTKKATWACKCDCGGMAHVIGANLKNGTTKSCGCISIDRMAKLNKTHGLSSKVPEYSVWADMRSRCTNTNRKCYADYGARGIKVCERWDSFENFYSDMGKRPTSKHSIERDDVNGDYEPSNCRWATQVEQANNKTNSVYYTYKGTTKTFANWMRILSISRTHFGRMIKRMTFEEIVEKYPPIDAVIKAANN